MIPALLLLIIFDVSWNPQPDADFFEVWVKRGRKKEVVYPAPTNSFSLDLTLSETTKIKVRAINKSGKSAWSKQLYVNKSHICIEHGR